MREPGYYWCKYKYEPRLPYGWCILYYNVHSALKIGHWIDLVNPGLNPKDSDFEEIDERRIERNVITQHIVEGPPISVKITNKQDPEENKYQ